MSASELARAIRAGQVSAVDAVSEQLARIERFNGALNAVVTLDAEAARRRARDADRALEAGEVWGPLHGVPITVKDSFDTAGLRTVSGHASFSRRVPLDDAAAVSRLRNAGAIVVGKTNLPELASGVQTNNTVFGRTSNPWNLDCTPGGSSGGSAAAIAAGMSFLDLGSDIGGSIRIPAHFCGVYGLKATAGRILGKGHVASARPLSLPSGWEALLELASFGPIARSIDDLELGLSVLSEPGAADPAPQNDRSTSELKIAWAEDFGGTPLDADSRRVLADLVERLARAGALVSRRENAHFDFVDAWRVSGVCLGAINTLFQSPARRWGRRLLSPILRRLGPRHALQQGLFAGMSLDGARVREALDRRGRIVDDLEAFLGEWDAWICPVFPTAAFSHRAMTDPIDVDGRAMSQLEANLLHSVVFNLTGHPVVTLPVGSSSSGLPIGVQLVGRRGQERALLRVAKQVGSVTGGYRVPPGYE